MAKVGHDYDAARILHAKGLTLKQIHEQTRIPYETLVKYAQRHRWTTERTKAVQKVSANVQEQLIERSTGHLLKISGMADKVIDTLLAQDFATMPLDDLQTLASVADTFDRIARRTYGLDNDARRATGSVMIQVNTNGATTRASFAPANALVLAEPSDADDAEQLGG